MPMSLKRTGSRLPSGAAVAALFTGLGWAPAALADADALFQSFRDSQSYEVAQVLRRNRGPKLESVKPDQPAPEPETVDKEEAEKLRKQIIEENAGKPVFQAVEEESRALPPDDPLLHVRPGGQLLRDRETLTVNYGGGLKPDHPERRRPGEAPRPPEPEIPVDPTAIDAPPPRAFGPDDFLAIPDRWRLVDALGLIQENPLDPYHQNTLKGDKPIWEGHCFPFLEPLLGEAETNCFLVLLGISDTVLEPRSFPTPVGVQTTDRSGTNNLFGRPDQWLFSQNLIHGFSLVNGDTAFRPQDLEFRYTGAFNLNYADVKERRVLRADPGAGTSRFDHHYGVLDLFVDYHIANITDRYDFYSTRIGIQPYNADFRGFLFQDNQLGARFFGNWDNNLWQYNLAWFHRLEKDTNSGLNDVTKRPRKDDVFIASVYKQDFPVLGLTSQGTIVYNRNREKGDRFFDDNGFLARPTSFGSQRGRNYDVVYLGYNVDGRYGRINLTGSFYWALGEDDNIFTDRSANINAQFAAIEASIDDDWRRWRFSALYSSGDDDPFDDTQRGFDAIFENPQFAGADTSYWIRQQIPLIGGGGTGLSSRNAVIPSLRHSKEHGQSQFVNPGIILIGAGFDFDLDPTFRLSGNANYMWFNHTAPLEALRQQGDIANEIGLDLSLAAIWRPWMHQNVVFRLSGAVLVPGQGFDDLYGAEDGRDLYYSVLANLILTY